MQPRQSVFPTLPAGGSYGRYALSLVCLLALSACRTSMAPVSIRDGADSIEQGQWQMDAMVSPNNTFTLAYGVDDRLDVGIDLELTPALWARYTLIAQPNVPQPGQLALAGTLGLFGGSVDSVRPATPAEQPEQDGYVYYESTDTRVRGAYAGLIGSLSLPAGVQLSLAYRRHRLDYDDFVLFNPSWLFDFYPYFDPDDGEPLAVDSDDFRLVDQATATLSIPLRRHATVHAGAGCQFNRTENNPRLPSDECAWILGFSFTRR